MGLLSGLRVGVGTALSRFLAWLFSRDWPRKILLHGLSPEVQRRFVAELTLEATPDPEIAHAWLMKLGPERTRELILRVTDRNYPALRPQLVIDLASQARHLVHELLAIDAVVRDLVVNNEQSLAYAYWQFERYLDAIASHAGGIKGKRALEVGPGHLLVVPSLLLAAGLESYVGVDLFPIADVAPASYERVRADLAAWGGLVRAGTDATTRAALDRTRERFLEELDRVVKIEGSKVVFDPKRLELRCPVDASSLPFEEGRFDLCFSKSAFEHFKDAPSAARESVRVLAKGGVGLHEVDFRDHRSRARPLAFLRYDAATWTNYFDPASILPLPEELAPRRSPFEFTNRLRVSDLASAFRAAGAEVSVVPLETRPVTAEERADFHPAFRERSKEDLETLIALYVVKKP